MNIAECFETEAFNELINFSFEEVRTVFNMYEYYISPEQVNNFIEEASKTKNLYTDELDKIEIYSQNEYVEKVNSGEDVPEFDTPQYKIKNIETQTKRKLVSLIKKYFNSGAFQRYKKLMFTHEIFKEEAVETPHELLVSLNVNKNRIYSLLTLIGYYQRHCHYFLSKADFLKICYDYSHQAYTINKNLGMEYRFVNIFIGTSRIKPTKSKKPNTNVDTNVDRFISDQYQNRKFIDVDKISLLMLIQPYLKNNTQELNKIIEIMNKNFKKYMGELAWKKTMDETNEFIAECEAKGIMKRL